MRSAKIFYPFSTLFLLLNITLLLAAGGLPQIYINEFMASNVLAWANADGEYEDWIEIYNASDYSVDLAGYFLTNNLAAGEYWQIPAGQADETVVPGHGFRILYADKMPERGAAHLNFKLDREGGQIALISPDKKTIPDKVTYLLQFRDISFGRSPIDQQWVYSETATPNKMNQPGYADFLYPPLCEQLAGFYPNPLLLSVLPARQEDVLRFELDGTDPTEKSARYSLPLLIEQTAIFKIRSFQEAALPGPIVSRAFFINIKHTLPVLVLMTDPQNLFDPEKGIYVHDEEGREWERFAELEFFKNGQLVFHAPAGIRIQGNTGPSAYQKKSFRAFFRSGYGEERLKYPLYSPDGVNSFARLVLRSGYDDSMEPTAEGKNARAALIRDPLATKLWQQCGGLVPRSQLTVLYLNRDFNGIYDIKESIDENFLMDHLKFKDVDIMRTRWDAFEYVYGDPDKWNELLRYFEKNYFGTDKKIAEAGQLIDLDNFITLQAFVHAFEYKNWGYGVFMFRDRADGGRWQWTIWDADRAVTGLSWNGFTDPYNIIAAQLDDLITKKLLLNEAFKVKYINRFADLLNTVFLPAHVAGLIDSFAQAIAPEIPAEAGRWNSTVEQWNTNIDFLKDFVKKRPEIVRQQLQDYLHLNGLVEITVGSDNGKGSLKVNSLTINQFPWKGKYFRQIPITLTAVPASGYRFVGWSDAALPAQESITLCLACDKSIAAIFEPVGNTETELITPKSIKSGQRFPIVVRIRDANGEINPIDQTPILIKFETAHADTQIQIKRGAGTGIVQIDAKSSFTLGIQNDKIKPVQKRIEISSNPTMTYSGNLPAGTVIWDNTADRFVADHLTIPAGCHLRIMPGTWVLVKKNVNFYVQGTVTVEGTENAPVIITSEKWAEAWGGMEFSNGRAAFRYCIVLNGGGDPSRGNPAGDSWHTGHQHIFFGKNNSEFNFDQCFFLYSPGKVFGAHQSKVNVANSVSAFVWHGGEFHQVLLNYRDSHLMNLPNDDHLYVEDIDTDGFHIDYLHPQYPAYSIIDRCYFITGKDDAIDHHCARLKISNCWIEDFTHEGVAASGGDTVRIFNTVALKNDQGFEAGWTESGEKKGPFVFIDHCVAVENNVGLRIGDSYDWTYRDFMKVTNTILYQNKDNIWNYLNSTHAPLAGALEISYSMTNDPDYDASAFCITGVPQFDPYYYLLPGSPGIGRGTDAANMGRMDSTAAETGLVVINEIMYKASADFDTGDWIELYNCSSKSQTLAGWSLKDNNDTHVFQLPESVTLPPDSYWVLCTDTAAFQRHYPLVKNISGNIPFGFGERDQVRLFSCNGKMVDSVAYQNCAPWPAEADGKGHSLELQDPRKDNSSPGNWFNSFQFGGTPGRANQCVKIREDSENKMPAAFILEQNFPNPFNQSTQIACSIPRPGRIKLSIFDTLGRKVFQLNEMQLRPAGRYQIHFDNPELAGGIYFYQIQLSAENYPTQILTKKMVLIK